MYLELKTKFFSKITIVVYTFISCAYYICAHIFAERNKYDTTSDLGEQYM